MAGHQVSPPASAEGGGGHGWAPGQPPSKRRGRRRAWLCTRSAPQQAQRAVEGMAGHQVNPGLAPEHHHSQLGSFSKPQSPHRHRPAFSPSSGLPRGWAGGDSLSGPGAVPRGVECLAAPGLPTRCQERMSTLCLAVTTNTVPLGGRAAQWRATVDSLPVGYS